MQTTMYESQELYQMIRENRFAMYAKPRRYFNRDGQSGSAFKFLFLIEAIVFFLIVFSAGTAMSQQVSKSENMLLTENTMPSPNIINYTSVYNSGKIFLNWTTSNEREDCIYVIERSADDKDYQSVGVKEGIASDIELFYSWVDQNPMNGSSYYRVKKIMKDGTMLYSASNSILNTGSSFNAKSNYAQGSEKKSEQR